MNILLDTHTLLWWLDDYKKLSKKAFELIKDPENICYVSSASLWEISIKRKLGKLKIPNSFYDIFDQQNFEELSISFEHSKNIFLLPNVHKDPFDRMLISQSIVENLTLLSKDKVFKKYSIRVIAA